MIYINYFLNFLQNIQSIFLQNIYIYTLNHFYHNKNLFHIQKNNFLNKNILSLHMMYNKNYLRYLIFYMYNNQDDIYQEILMKYYLQNILEELSQNILLVNSNNNLCKLNLCIFYQINKFLLDIQKLNWNYIYNLHNIFFLIRSLWEFT